MSLEDVVREAAAGITGVDSAAVELALKYAVELDSGGDLVKVGPLLLAALESLQLTPRSRSAKGGDDASGISNPLDELRARRSSRVNDPSTVDTAATGADA